MNSPWPSKWSGLFLWFCGMALTGAGCVGNPHFRSSVFEVPEPSSAEPVTAAMKTDQPTARPGDTFDVMVCVRIAGGHHIYSTNAVAGPFTPTTLNLVVPAGLEPVGGWIVPSPATTKTGQRVYTDSLLFRRSLKVRLNTPPGVLSIKGELRYQACTEELCWPPGNIGVSASVAVVSTTKE